MMNFGYFGQIIKNRLVSFYSTLKKSSLVNQQGIGVRRPLLSLFTKLFLAFVFHAVLLMGLMMFAVHNQVRSEFRDFLQQQESGRLRYVVGVLEQHYAIQRSWHLLENQRIYWLIILQESLRQAVLEGENFPSSMQRPRKHGPRDLFEDFDEPFELFESSPDLDGPRARKPPRAQEWGRNLTLVDMQGRLIAGQPSNQTVVLRLPINYRDRLVGFLQWHGNVPQSGLRFLERNLQWLWFFGGSLVLLGALIAWLVSRQLLKPVHELKKGTEKLREHQLDTRIPVATSDELGQLAQAFNEMAAALQNYEYQRQQWLADTAHELRTPLSILKGEIEALEDGVRSFDQNSLASLHQETTRLQRIVEDLRLINHLELGKLELFLRPLELNKLVTEALKQAQTRLEAAKVQVNLVPTQAELSINGDYDRLHQVLLNLMENTARHAPESNLDIRSGFDQNEAVLLLSDNGPGVSEADLPHLFDRFYRTEQSRNRVSGGSGLGLAICQELMQAHQGRISARRGSFGGLEVELRWPLLEKKNE